MRDSRQRSGQTDRQGGGAKQPSERAARLIEKLAATAPELAGEAEQLALELESTAAALDDAKRVRSSFLQNLSHEVRTPITVMRGLLDILAEDVGPQLNDSQRDLIDRVRHSSQQVLDLIQGLLDLTKAEAGLVEARRFAVYFPDLVSDLVRGVEPALAAKGLTFAVDLPRGIDWLTV
ncbi:MAG: sensor histidine kinase, partial [Candidatus Binatia bacterium]